MATKRLYRSRTDRIIWGVCGGLAHYFDIDPVIVRIIFVLMAFANGIGLLAYIILAIVVPLEGSTSEKLEETARENVQEIRQSAEDFGNSFRPSSETTPAEQNDKASSQKKSRIAIGIIIVVIGLIFLAASLNWFWWFSWNRMWPVLLIVAGLLIILSRTRKNHE